MFWIKPIRDDSSSSSKQENFAFENLPNNDNTNKATTTPAAAAVVNSSKTTSNTNGNVVATSQKEGTNKRNIMNNNNNHNNPQVLSMKFVKCLSGLVCQECGTDPLCSITTTMDKTTATTTTTGGGGSNSPSGLTNLQTLQPSSSSSISPLVLAPMMMRNKPYSLSNDDDDDDDDDNANAVAANTIRNNQTTGGKIEAIMGEYMALCQFYKVPYNAGVLSTLRFSLPCLRVTGSFHDLDMLALTELLLHHANTTLRHISRLDFSIASKEGKQFKSYKLGFTSHGALALAKVLQTTRYIPQVWLPRHRIGPYGASAIFLACQENPTIQTLNMRRCRIGERGAFAFCESLSATKVRGLIDVDLSSNGIGHRGTVAIQRLLERQNTTYPHLFVNLEGNLVFPEIMNGITHGLGVILSIVGGYLLSERVKGLSHTHVISCTIYTTSLLALYTSSTLFHSFFALQNTKYIFQVFDKCAIYILIAGSYTPFLQILLGDQPIWSVGLLGFIWTCGFFGIGVEAFYPTWKHRSTFSLAMYLGMGWAAVVCLPSLKDRLEKGCINLLVLGGVGYTAGVPFFVRDNNLDHAIWHLFVLSGSILHWMAIYIYVAPLPLTHADE